MPAKNSRLKPSKIIRHSRKKFGVLNSLQMYVANSLTENALKYNLILTKGSVNYIVGEVSDPTVVGETTESTANEVLLLLLKATDNHTQKIPVSGRVRSNLTAEYTSKDSLSSNSLSLLYFSSLMKTLRAFNCPKPWC